jgi:TPR repeat protein/tRNA A-37 threonylcarbamoyl transferase component Bud32
MQSADPRTTMQLAEDGNVDAQLEVGKLKLSQERYDDAAVWLRRAADQGNPDAMCLYGSLLSEGLGVDQDHEAAAYWLRQAADYGHSRAQLLLAESFLSGQGVPTNHQIAATWYLRAGEQGDKCAQWRYGQLLRNGQGVEKNLEEAVVWFRKAAEAGHVEAMIELAETLRDLPTFNSDEFLKWAEAASKQGSVHGLYLMGWAFENTFSITRIDDAVALYRKAAEAGSGEAQMRLGKLYAEGKIVAADQQEAERWLSMAVSEGKAADVSAKIPNDSLAAISSYATVNEYPPGTILDNKYFIMSVLGKGGMCMVYKAKHLLMNKMVALKMLLPETAQDKGQVERFRREAQAASSLNHPNIIAIHDLSMSPDGKPFMVMDFLEGVSLEQRIEAGPMPLLNFLSIFMQVASALSTAHEAGIVHRDIKPSNIMLVNSKGSSEMVKVVDFGLAKLLEPGEDQHKLTKSGEVFGTLMYMSPEQCLGHPLDPRTDIYSVGCAMYETIAGYPAFRGATPFEVMSKHVNTAPDPLPASLNIPDKLKAIIHKSLEKDREKRQQTMSELHEELADVLANMA